MSLNSITISGTLKKAPEKRFTPTSIPVTNMLLEVSYIPRGSQNNPGMVSSQVIRVNAWRDLAEECEKRLKAGDKILVIGRVQINAYTTNEGKKKKEVEIDASSVTLIEDVMSVRAPQHPTQNASEVTESVRENESFKKSTSNEVEQISDLEQVVNSTEEIPF